MRGRGNKRYRKGKGTQAGRQATKLSGGNVPKQLSKGIRRCRPAPANIGFQAARSNESISKGENVATQRGKRPRRKAGTHEGPYTPVVRKDRRGNVITHKPKLEQDPHRRRSGWFSGHDDPEFGHRTRAAAMRKIPQAERERGLVPRLLTFDTPLYG